jgi:hypothetical protein
MIACRQSSIRDLDDGKYLYLYVPYTNREQNNRSLAKEDTENHPVVCVCVRTEYREEKPSMYAHTTTP